MLTLGAPKGGVGTKGAALKKVSLSYPRKQGLLGLLGFQLELGVLAVLEYSNSRMGQ